MPPLQVNHSSLPLSLASCSIGLPRHTLHQKIEAISRASFTGIELSFPDLLSHAKELRSLGQLSEAPGGGDGDDIDDDDWPALCKAAEHVRQLCSAHGLHVLVLQPFANYEGWPDGSAERSAVLARADGWARIMQAAGTDMLQVGSTDTLAHRLRSSRAEDLAADLAALADMLAARDPSLRIAYENWCWATHAPGWRDVWEIVRIADRPNIGLCLDTFQSAGGEWGNPTTASGLVEREGLNQSALTAGWLSSLRDLVRTVPADKIYFLQISDAYRVQPPLADRPEPDDESGLRPRGRWSHDYRPLPYDGGYLPIADFTRAVLETGYTGWLSVEVFDGEFEKKYGDDLMRFAEKARDSTRRLVEEAAGMQSL